MGDLNISRKKNVRGKYNMDLHGIKFGLLEVKRWIARDSKWVCECACGNEIELTSQRITDPPFQPFSCGCTTRKLYEFQERVGKRYGKLLVEGVRQTPTGYIFACNCDCGRQVFRTRVQLDTVTIKEKSCGCVKVDRKKENGNKNYKNKSFKELEVEDLMKRYLNKVYNGRSVVFVGKDKYGQPELKLACDECGFKTYESVPNAVRGKFHRCLCNTDK